MRFHVPIALCLFIVMALPAFAFNASSGAEFLNVNTSTRSEGLGGADPSVVTDISGINTNVSSIAFMKVPEVYYMHKSILNEFNTEYVALGTPMTLFIRSVRSLPKPLRWVRKIRLGFFVNYWHTGDIEVFGNEHERPIGTVGARDFYTGLGLGYNLRGYRIGGSFKYVQRNLGDFKATTVAFDLGALKGYEVPRPLPYQKRYNLRVGLAIRNVGPGIKFNDEAEALPITFRPGITYGIVGNRDHMVDAMFAITQIIGEPLGFNTGLEYRVFNHFFFRSGFDIVTSDGIAWTVGTGGEYTFRKVTYRLDYAFWSRKNQIPDNHTFSLLAQLKFIGVGKKRRVTSLGIIEGDTPVEEPKKRKIKVKKKKKKKKR